MTSVVVAQKHRRAVRAGRLEQRVDRLVEQLLETRRARDRVGDAVHRVHFADALAQLLALAHVARGAEHVGDRAVVARRRASPVVSTETQRPCARAQPRRDRLDRGAGRAPRTIPCAPPLWSSGWTSSRMGVPTSPSGSQPVSVCQDGDAKTIVPPGSSTVIRSCVRSRTSCWNAAR